MARAFEGWVKEEPDGRECRKRTRTWTQITKSFTGLRRGEVREKLSILIW